ELVLRLAGHRAVQVDEMDPLRTLLEPVLRHGGGVFGEHGGALHVALLQAHAMTILDVDRGNDLHGSGWPGNCGVRPRARPKYGGRLRASVPGDEVGEQAQSRAVAFFRMELHGEDISPRNGAS